MSGLDTSLIGVTNQFDVGDANYRAAQNNLLQQKVNEGNNTRNRQSDIYKALMNKPQGVSPGKHLIDSGYADEGLALEKQQSEINKQNISNNDDEINSHIKSINIANMAMREMLAYPQLNKNIIKSVIDNYHNNGLTSPEIYQKQIAELPNIPDDDAGIRSFIEGQTQSLMKAEDYYKQNHLSAYEKAQIENQDKGRALQARGYDIQEQGQGITQQNNLANQSFEGERIKLNRDDKSFEQAYKRGQQDLDNKKYELSVAKETGKNANGAPSVDMQKMNKGQEQLGSLLDIANSHLDDLNKSGALSSKENNAASNVLASVGNSTIGQVAGRAFGTKEQTLRDNIQNLKPRILSAIMAATGMSSKSMDSNVELKMAMDSLGNMNQSVESQMQVIKNLKATYLNGAGNGSTESYGDNQLQDFVNKHGGTIEQAKRYLHSIGKL